MEKDAPQPQVVEALGLVIKNRDPISYVRGVLLEQKWMSEAELKEVEAEVKKVVEKAVQFAEKSPNPEAHELYEDVYTQKDYPFVKD